MSTTMKLTTAIKKVEEVLIGIGLTKKTMQTYKSFGFKPIIRFYEEKNKTLYSEKTTEQFVYLSRRQYENGEIGCSKFQHIRKVSEMLKECNQTGTTSWCNVTPWNTTKLEEPFAKYLRSYETEKLALGFRKTTMRGYKPVIKHFLLYIKSLGYENLLNITRENISEYIPVLAEKYTRPGDCLSALRSFGDFLSRNNLSSIDISSVLQTPVPAHKKYAIGFTKEEVDKILTATNQNNSCGKRDYAILMLAKYTGLRAIDVLGLCFNDINWEKHEVNIVQHKTGQSITLPIEISVCNSIADYILNGRPKSEQPYIFLRSRGPFRKLESWSGYSIVKRKATKAGIFWSADERKGFHSFRRSLGNWMLEAEIPLSTISEVLGHAHQDSTKPYIATHEASLRNCAMTLCGIETAKEELM